MISMQFNNTISERDMDLLFVESILTDPEFCRLLIDKTNLKGKPFHVISAELSKSDSDLGESDITVVIDIKGDKYGLLIEDKIDAIAMPEQHDRYTKRGKKGIKACEYKDFRVFILCPEKYYMNNDEAKLYEHILTYEECKGYYDSKDDPLNAFRSQQIEQAITKAKKPASINVNEKANAFLKQYIRYQKENYPTLDLSTKEDKNGWWTDYRTELGSVYINHKIEDGYVDLTFPKASDKIDKAKVIAEWARQHKISDVSVVKTQKSAMFRIHVPKLDIIKGFEFVDKDELNQCFDAIKELTDFANIIEIANTITFR
ncbi:PD-(D/E)XK nuclease family protein [Aristaeella hokkaidonensis]|uniref:PD-(D/E)XK nuclease family protein n=1 Tax=Aristaeella hokkaidonensis TaxID=3046382 RepID=A0AC61N1R0_9FIRM|nr:PD-(D/E)XK nuclease family protein [Aristaeella hokkaidonensis]QUC66105.1 PD-(D/E)XK nuclease family protein [Aristaeella hokkaidonensis]SNT94892.1 PD-(D/E)XK nuclease superfamily protein [Aristaeella hokkaidonensis]